MTGDMVVAAVGVAAALLVAAGYTALAVDSWRAGVAPNGVTWVFACVLSAVALESQWRLGGWWSLGSVVVQIVGCVVMVSLAVRRRWRWTAFDRSMLLLAALVLGVRIGVGSPTVAVWLTIVADCVAMAPCIRDARLRPHEVAPRGWWLDAAGGALSTVAVAAWNPTLLAYPIYITLVNLAVLEARRRGLAARRHGTTPVPAPPAVISVAAPSARDGSVESVWDQLLGLGGPAGGGSGTSLAAEVSSSTRV